MIGRDVSAGRLVSARSIRDSVIGGKTVKHIMLAVACTALLAAPALGGVDEGPVLYAVGSQVIGQGGWTGWNAGSFPSAVVAADPAGTAGNNVLKEVTSNNLVREVTGSTSGTWVFKAKQYIPTTAHTNSAAANRATST